MANFIELYNDVLELGALSQSTRKLEGFDKRSPEWREAIKEHAERLVNYGAFVKFDGSTDGKPGSSFFTGRMVDGLPKARLVANGALHSDTPVDSYLPLIHERYLFVTEAARRARNGHKLYGGDISGAYYNTPGEGSLYLPHNWPAGVGGFAPKEKVTLKCAIPGDTLSSGLFLSSLAK